MFGQFNMENMMLLVGGLVIASALVEDEVTPFVWRNIAKSGRILEPRMTTRVAADREGM